MGHFSREREAVIALTAARTLANAAREGQRWQKYFPCLRDFTIRR